MMQVGDPSVVLSWSEEYNNVSIPPGYSKFTFNCTEGFTQSFDDDEITIIKHNMHMHALGTKMVMKIYGSDRSLKQNSVVEHYDFDQQGGYAASGGFKVQKGDTFEVDCYYHNTGAPVKFGT